MVFKMEERKKGGAEAVQNKMGTVKMLPLIVKMSVPVMFSMLVMAMYNIVDSIFVANYDQDALTAISLAFPIQTLIIAVAVGTGVGINSVVSRRLGEGRREDADSVADHGVLLGVICGVVFAAIGLFFTRMFFESFTTSKPVIEYGVQYITIVMVGSFSVFLEINLEKTLQATGNTFYPMLFQLSGAVTNIILDPILIFGYFGFPEMGAAGAAVATVTGQIVAMIFSFVIFAVKSHEVKLNLKHFKFSLKTIKDIYQVGFPAMIMQSIAAVLVFLLNKILIGFSEVSVSVLGVYYKLQSFIFMPVFGLNQSLMSIIGFNYGARNKKRMKDALKIGLIFSVAIMVIGTIIFEVFPNQLLSIFDKTGEMQQIGVIAFRLIAICFIPAAIGIVFSTFFQAVGMGMKSLITSILRQLVIILPAAWLLSKIGLDYVWLSFPLAEIVALFVGIGMMVSANKKVISQIPD